MSKKAGCKKGKYFLVEQYELAVDNANLFCTIGDVNDYVKKEIKRNYGSVRTYKKDLRYGVDSPKDHFTLFKIEGMPTRHVKIPALGE